MTHYNASDTATINAHIHRANLHAARFGGRSYGVFTNPAAHTEAPMAHPTPLNIRQRSAKRRQHLLDLLAEGPKSVDQLCKMTHSNASGIYHDMAEFVKSGAVVRRLEFVPPSERKHPNVTQMVIYQMEGWMEEPTP